MTTESPKGKACCSGRSQPRIRQIVVGHAIVGLAGLDDALEQLYRLGREPGPETAQELLEMLATHNYIPPIAYADYKEALLHEYIDYCAEDGTEM
jgi:hypothetical protein